MYCIGIHARTPPPISGSIIIGTREADRLFPSLSILRSPERGPGDVLITIYSVMRDGSMYDGRISADTLMTRVRRCSDFMTIGAVVVYDDYSTIW